MDAVKTVTANGMVHQKRLMDDLKSIKGGIVDVDKVDTLLENMEINLTEKETSDLKQNLPADGGIIDVSKVGSLFQNMGMNLTEMEISDLTHKLPVDAAGNVLQDRILDGMKSIKGGEVNTSNLDSVLGYLGIKLTQKEHEGLIENLPLSANGKVALCTLMDAVTAVTGGEVDVSDLENILGKIGIELTDKECLELQKNLPVDVDGKVFQNRLMDGVKTLKGGTIDVNKLDSVLGNMGFNLTEKEMNDLKSNLPINGPKVDVQNLKAILNNMGIELTDNEQMKLLQKLPVDDIGKIYKNKLLDGVKSFKGGKVPRSKMNTALEIMGIKLTEKELKSLADNLPVNANGKIALNTLMDAVVAVTGGEIDISDMENILGEIGIELTDKECMELKKYLPDDADGKVYQNRLMDGVKSSRGGIIDVTRLDTVLEKMGMKLTETENNDLIKNLPVDVNGKVEMKKLMDESKAFTGKKVDADNLLNVLGNMGIDLTEKEYVELLQTLPIDAAGKVYQNRLLNGVKSSKGGMVKVGNLHTVLGNLGVELTKKEHEDLTESLLLNANGKVDLNTLMEAVETITGEEIDVSDVENVLEKIGVTFTDKDHVELEKNLPVNANRKVYMNRLMDALKSLKVGTIDVSKLDSVLRNMGLNLTEKEMKNLKSNLPINAEGKVAMKKLGEGIEAFVGPKVDVRYLQDILNNTGIDLTDKEQMTLLKTLPADAAGKIYKNRLFDGVKSLKGGKVKRSKMNTALENMGIKLTEKELKSVADNLPVNGTGMVELDKLMDRVKVVTGGKVDISKLDTVLGEMGMTISEMELKDTKKNLPVDVDAKVDMKKLVDGMKAFTGKKTDVNGIQNTVGSMGIELTEEESLNLRKTLPTDDVEMVFQNKLLEGVKSFKEGPTFLELSKFFSERIISDLDISEKVSEGSILFNWSTVVGIINMKAQETK
nr:uncharacterized protein LOC111760565 [Dasypus novemcinctus]